MKFRRKKIRRSRILRRRRRVRIVLFSLLVILIFSGVTMLLRYDGLFINNVTIEGTEVVKANEVQMYIKEVLGESYIFGLIPKRNVLIYPKRRIKRELPEIFTDIKKAKINVERAEELIVNIVEHERTKVWCRIGKIEAETLPAQECFFIDDTGYIFAKSPFRTLTPYFTYEFEAGHIDIKKLENIDPIKQEIVGNYIISHTNDLRDLLKKIEVEGNKLFISKDGDYELYINEGAKVYFSENQDILEVFENLSSVIASDVFSELGIGINERLSKIDYIDLRFGKKIFYTYR